MEEFQELYRKYNRPVYQYLYKLTGFRSDLAEELTQETFYQVYLSLSSYQGRSGLFTWICSIAKHVCIKYYRKNRNTLQLDPDEAGLYRVPARGPSTEERIEQKVLAACAMGEIMRLKKKYRDVLIYRLVFELPFREIADLMGIQENSAKVLFHRGKEMVRCRLEEQGCEGVGI